MGEFLKVGGKYNDVAIGMNVNSDGTVNVVRHNQINATTIVNEVEKRDTDVISVYGANTVDLTDWTTFNLLVRNTLDVDCRFIFYTQMDTSSSRYLKGIDGSAVSLTIPHNATGDIIITPEDYPIFNHLRYFKGGFYFDTAPTSGALTVMVIRKR